MSTQHISEATRVRVRDWIVVERTFTCAYASWDIKRTTGITTHASAVKTVVEEMMAKGALRLIEDHGRAGKVYEYVEPRHEAQVHRLPERRAPLPELDAAIGIGAAAPARGREIAHTGGPVGPSGRPGRDRKRQEAGFRVKRQRQGT